MKWQNSWNKMTIAIIALLLVKNEQIINMVAKLKISKVITLSCWSNGCWIWFHYADFFISFLFFRLRTVMFFFGFFYIKTAIE